ncbi:MAG: hypothetical protein GY805_08535 [Chloroflexi bacterium]|nr:hypothetical protein [Chloroflexota bacterium]
MIPKQQLVLNIAKTWLCKRPFLFLCLFSLLLAACGGTVEETAYWARKISVSHRALLSGKSDGWPSLIQMIPAFFWLIGLTSRD